MGGSGGGFEPAANLNTFSEENLEFCLLDVAIVEDDVREGGDKTFTVQAKAIRRF